MQLTLDADHWIDPVGLQRPETLIRKQPFPFFVARDMLPANLLPVLKKDFPTLGGAGYLPYEAANCGKSLNALIDHILAPEFANAIGNTLGIENLAQYPTYVSICRSLNKRHGTIHTDGKSKVATALLYLNDNWESAGKGCLRFLNRIDNIEDTVVPEIKPVYGTLVAFKRTENSFHGHLPFEGERRVIQIAWLVSAADKDRKAKRGRLSQGLKTLLGWLDRKIGQGRDDSASHK